jgi:hypothetical protein
MSRYDLTLNSAADKARAISWLQKARQGWTMTLREPKRNADQNAKMWAMLSEITAQRKVHCGVKMTPELWKCVFMHALGQEVSYLHTLDGGSIFPAGFRSSELTVKQMADLITLIEAWAAQSGVTFHDQQEKAA